MSGPAKSTSRMFLLKKVQNWEINPFSEKYGRRLRNSRNPEVAESGELLRTFLASVRAPHYLRAMSASKNGADSLHFSGEVEI